MNDLQIVEYNDIRVITTKQVAEAYGASPKKVSNNFNANKKRYTEGKHYFVLEGEELKDLQSRNSGLQKSNKTRKLYLWTERGALLLAKSINTDTAWEAYERLVDFYFQKKMEQQTAIEQATKSFPPNYPNPIYNTSSTPVPKNPNWYARNRRRMIAICEKADVPVSMLYHHILLRLGEEYDLDAANQIYCDENGHAPKYALDIVSYFPDLARLATAFLDIIEKKL